MLWVTIYAAILASSVAIVLLAATLILSRRLERLNPVTAALAPVSDVELHVLDSRSNNSNERAPALVLLHGANLDMRDLQLAAGERLSSRFRTIFIDRPGQGHSAIGRRDMLAPQTQAALLHQALKVLKPGRFIMVAHSLGGLVALQYAMNYPEDVAGLVLVNPTSHPRASDLLPRQRIAGRLIGPAIAWTCAVPLADLTCAMFSRRLFRPQSPPADYVARSGLALGMTPRRLLASLAEYEGLRAELIRIAPLYPQLQAPTVVIAGEADTIVPPVMHARKLVEALPKARLVELAGAGHMAHHGHIDAILDAIESLTPQAAR